MLWLIPIFLVLALTILPGSLMLAEVAWSPVKAPAKTRLRLAVQRVARSQAAVSSRSEKILLLFSLTCALLTLAFLPGCLTHLLSIPKTPAEATGVITCRYAPMMYLGLFVLLQAAGQISLALTERGRHPIAGLLLNGYFWLPLLLAFTSVAAYLPVYSDPEAGGATAALWLLLLQPAGILALQLALTGPAILINAQPNRQVSPLQHWIREFHILNTALVMVIVMVSLTCFAPRERLTTTQDILRCLPCPVLPLILLGIHYRLIRFLKRRGEFQPEVVWKLVLWLSLIAVSSSFLAFHVLGMSDHFMHMLLNFSLLAIWWGFVVPRFPLSEPLTQSGPHFKTTGELHS